MNRLLPSELDELLRDWAELNRRVMELTEEQLLQALEHEKANKARLRVLHRLQHRFSKLRGIRERQELTEKAHG